MKSQVLNYKKFGKGPPLIILHGLFGMLDNWQTIARKLASHYTVFILDQRNHGRSFHHPIHTYQAMAEDLKIFLESKWIHKTSLLGHSMGGKTAMKFATEYPHAVSHLIIADIAPKIYQDNHRLIFDVMCNVREKTIQNRKEADAILATKIESLAIRQFLLKNLNRKKEGGYQWKMNLPAIKKYYSDILNTALKEGDVFEGKTLFLKGERSPYILEGDEEIIHQHFPNAIIESIPNTGHWLHAEAPEVVIHKTYEFLAQ